MLLGGRLAVVAHAQGWLGLSCSGFAGFCLALPTPSGGQNVPRFLHRDRRASASCTYPIVFKILSTAAY
jgi:hypothetical protein